MSEQDELREQERIDQRKAEDRAMEDAYIEHEHELGELRLKIARLQGWKIFDETQAKEYLALDCDEKILMGGPRPMGIHRMPDWPRDPAAAYTLEETITDYDDRVRYFRCLVAAIREDDRADELDPPWGWRVVHATPEQKCRAYIAWKETAAIAQAEPQGNG